MKQVFVRRWFLVCLFVVLAGGFLFSDSLSAPAERFPRTPIVAAVLFLMALPLEIRTLVRALRQPAPVILAVAINFGLVPPLAWLVAPMLYDDWATGLVIMAAIPCTLASAVVWTRRAGGNDAVAMLVTLITNLACFIVTPAWLRVLTGTEVALEFGELVERLALLVVLPILVAQLLRLARPVAAWATANSRALGVLAQFGILSMVGLGSIRSGAELAATGAAEAVGTADWALMLGAVLGVHLAALLAGHLLSGPLGIGRPERIAVGFGGSQKTLMVGLDIGLEYYSGLTILPMVAYHVSQLLVDTLIADRLRGRGATASRHGLPEPND